MKAAEEAKAASALAEASDADAAAPSAAAAAGEDTPAATTAAAAANARADDAGSEIGPMQANYVHKYSFVFALMGRPGKSTTNCPWRRVPVRQANLRDVVKRGAG